MPPWRPRRCVARAAQPPALRPWALLALLALLLPLAQAPALGEAPPPTRRSLREAEVAARAAKEAAAEAERAAHEAARTEEQLAEQRAAAGRRAVAADAAADAAARRAKEAAAIRDAALVDLGRRAEAMAPLLPLMRRLQQWPSETLLAVPGDPETTLRGVLVLRSLMRHLSAEAEALRQAQAVAAEATRRAEAEAAELDQARAEVRAAAAAVEASLAEARSRHTALEQERMAAAQQAASTAAHASDLRDMLERLEQARAKAEAEAKVRAEREAEAAAARTQAARGQTEAEPRQRASIAPVVPVPQGGRAVPVAGRIARDFGDSGAGGPARGLTYAAPPGARVVSPCGGSIAFAGPFRSYGQLLIVDCGRGYHFVLAGLERLDAELGARVLAGEAVGQLGDGGENGRAALYVELRRDGKPVDPKGWFRVRS
ncbi:peptidoglycan DD-metalloendopeptidase family protein [Roseomonas sp. E05]|uniref:murein hydrolase activator EnvC family protein n=1 Tax=Roseomonas sp. E05 TaxID=3046310 RepID=UPI0024BB98A9|nr:peptidoglycan DD-metalloendopeptidase family protein [Roseomonas sp. E05]MDJ0386538.1 peptidoglycan DD-metalloendopeptidase family protein [Roseomonas sp. E05]